MRSFRPHEITELSASRLDVELPFFPFPESPGSDGSG